jgi:hypothetical protein
MRSGWSNAGLIAYGRSARNSIVRPMQHDTHSDRRPLRGSYRRRWRDHSRPDCQSALPPGGSQSHPPRSNRNCYRCHTLPCTISSPAHAWATRLFVGLGAGCPFPDHTRTVFELLSVYHVDGARKIRGRTDCRTACSCCQFAITLWDRGGHYPGRCRLALRGLRWVCTARCDLL